MTIATRKVHCRFARKTDGVFSTISFYVLSYFYICIHYLGRISAAGLLDSTEVSAARHSKHFLQRRSALEKSAFNGGIRVRAFLCLWPNLHASLTRHHTAPREGTPRRHAHNRRYAPMLRMHSYVPSMHGCLRA